MALKRHSARRWKYHHAIRNMLYGMQHTQANTYRHTRARNSRCVVLSPLVYHIRAKLHRGCEIIRASRQMSPKLVNIDI